MSSLSPTITITVSPRLARYLRQTYTSNKEVLQFSRGQRTLTVWKWPTNALDEPIAADALREHCEAFRIPGPGCLCPLKDIDQPYFVEASISIVTRAGFHIGEYVAECSSGFCGYFVPLQRIYLHIYFEKTAGIHASKGSNTPMKLPTSKIIPTRKHLKRSYASLDLELEAYTIPLQIPSSRQVTDTEILLKLNDYTQPGLYDVEFRELLERMVRCSCGMVMLRRVYKEHRCDLAYLKPLKRQRLEDWNQEGNIGLTRNSNDTP